LPVDREEEHFEAERSLEEEVKETQENATFVLQAEFGESV